MYFKNIYKTLMRLEQLEQNRTRVKKTTSLNVINLPVSVHAANCRIVASCLLCYSKTLELNSCVGNERWNKTHSVVKYA